MKQNKHITIKAPLNLIFAAASDLTRWPEFLSHFRYNRFISHTPSGGVVKMSCIRSGIPTTWESEYRIDTEKRELHFLHLKSTLNATKGMKVVWSFKELADGEVQVNIVYDLAKGLSILGISTSDWLIGKFFIEYVATRTLAGLKRKVEAQAVLRTHGDLSQKPRRRKLSQKSVLGAAAS